MKQKPNLPGILLYIGLLLLFSVFPNLLHFFEYADISIVRFEIMECTLILGGAFLLKRVGKASFRELTTAIIIAILVSIVFSAKEDPRDPFSYLVPAMAFSIVWLIAAIGIGTALLTERIWPSRLAGRIACSLTLFLTLSVITLPYLASYVDYRISVQSSSYLTPPALKCDASELKTTRVISQPKAPIISGTNLIWCTTFQLAWNDMLDLLGEEIHFIRDEPKCVSILNQRSIQAEFLDAETYLTFAGEHTVAFTDEINSSVSRRFGKAAFEPVAPPDAPGLAAFCYLQANLSFEHAFQRADTPLIFNGEPVEAFRIPFGEGFRRRAELAEDQVSVMYPPDNESFIVELHTCKPDHHLVLAKIPSETTLQQTIEKACSYTDTLKRESIENIPLRIPLLNFDIDRNYSELIDKQLQLKNPDFAGWYISKAFQDIRFQLDERGAVLKSNSALEVSFGCGPTTPSCIFDEPFLLMLRYKDNPMPYFAIWVDNAEILVKPE